MRLKPPAHSNRGRFTLDLPVLLWRLRVMIEQHWAFAFTFVFTFILAYLFALALALAPAVALHGRLLSVTDCSA